MFRLTPLFAVLAVGLTAAQAQPTEGLIDPAAVAPEQGLCYTVRLDTPWRPDTPEAAKASCLRLFEGDEELGPAHSMHQTIRDAGGGAYSHWSGTPGGEQVVLYFSASDNTDPRTNGVGMPKSDKAESRSMYFDLK